MKIYNIWVITMMIEWVHGRARLYTRKCWTIGTSYALNRLGLEPHQIIWRSNHHVIWTRLSNTSYWYIITVEKGNLWHLITHRLRMRCTTCNLAYCKCKLECFLCGSTNNDIIGIYLFTLLDLDDFLLLASLFFNKLVDIPANWQMFKNVCVRSWQ